MAQSKHDLYKAVFAQYLAQANRGQVFHNKADAMQAFAVFHRVAK